MKVLPKPEKLPLKDFKYIFSKVPRLCVEVIVGIEDGVVLSKRDIPPAQGMWHIPGGGVLMGERLEEAVKRVAEDELGVKVRIERFLGNIEYLWENLHAVGAAYLVSIESGKLGGSYQAEEVAVYKVIPKNTVKEQKKFLVETLNLKEE